MGLFSSWLSVQIYSCLPATPSEHFEAGGLSCCWASEQRLVFEMGISIFMWRYST